MRESGVASDGRADSEPPDGALACLRCQIRVALPSTASLARVSAAKTRRRRPCPHQGLMVGAWATLTAGFAAIGGAKDSHRRRQAVRAPRFLRRLPGDRPSRNCPLPGWGHSAPGCPCQRSHIRLPRHQGRDRQGQRSLQRGPSAADRGNKSYPRIRNKGRGGSPIWDRRWQPLWVDEKLESEGAGFPTEGNCKICIMA